VALLLGVAVANGQKPVPKAPPRKAKAETVNYYRDIEPILTENCVPCHQASMAAGGLRLDAPENVLQGGASGPGVVPGKAQRSLLYQRVTDTTEKRMPPVGTALTDGDVALIRAWINSGASIEARPGTRPAPKTPGGPRVPGRANFFVWTASKEVSHNSGGPGLRRASSLDCFYWRCLWVELCLDEGRQPSPCLPYL